MFPCFDTIIYLLYKFNYYFIYKLAKSTPYLGKGAGFVRRLGVLIEVSKTSQGGTSCEKYPVVGCWHFYLFWS